MTDSWDNIKLLDKELQSATELWGEEWLRNMAMEELAELIQALVHLYRGRCTVDKVADEMADVLIILRQLSLLVGHSKLEEAIKNKGAKFLGKLITQQGNYGDEE